LDVDVAHLQRISQLIGLEKTVAESRKADFFLPNCLVALLFLFGEGHSTWLEIVAGVARLLLEDNRRLPRVAQRGRPTKWAVNWSTLLNDGVRRCCSICSTAEAEGRRSKYLGVNVPVQQQSNCAIFAAQLDRHISGRYIEEMRRRELRTHCIDAQTVFAANSSPVFICRRLLGENHAQAGAAAAGPRA